MVRSVAQRPDEEHTKGLRRRRLASRWRCGVAVRHEPTVAERGGLVLARQRDDVDLTIGLRFERAPASDIAPSDQPADPPKVGGSLDATAQFLALEIGVDQLHSGVNPSAARGLVGIDSHRDQEIERAGRLPDRVIGIGPVGRGQSPRQRGSGPARRGRPGLPRRNGDRRDIHTGRLGESGVGFMGPAGCGDPPHPAERRRDLNQLGGTPAIPRCWRPADLIGHDHDRPFTGRVRSGLERRPHGAIVGGTTA